MRSWTRWHRHITLAMLAHTYLAAIRRTAGGEKSAHDLKADLLPLAVPELRRLLWHLVWTRPPDHEAARTWSR